MLAKGREACQRGLRPVVEGVAQLSGGPFLPSMDGATEVGAVIFDT
jgi:hypothetical protein